MNRDETEFADFFRASWDPCLRAVAASIGNMPLAGDQVAEAFAPTTLPPGGALLLYGQPASS